MNTALFKFTNEHGMEEFAGFVRVATPSKVPVASSNRPT